MKKLIMLVAAASLLAACSTSRTSDKELPNQVLILDKEVQPMGRQEVINGIGECESNGMRAVMLYSKRKINGYTTDVVVDVTCAPKFKI